MTINHDDHTGADTALPQLSDDAVVQIQDFIYDVLYRFEAHYGDQIHRYYNDRAQHNMIGPHTAPTIDDPLF